MAGASQLRGLVATMAIVAATPATATPILGEPITAGPLRVFADDADPTTYYYAPGPLAVASAPEGGPDLRFLQLVYVGTPVTGDAGLFLARSVLSFRITQQPVPATALAAARAALPAGARLRAVAVTRLESHLVWTPVEGEAAREVGPARAEEPGADAVGDDGTWAERQVVITPGPYDSQLLWDALHRGRLVLSFGWAHHALGLRKSAGRLTATPGLLPPGGLPPEPAATPELQVVGAGAVEVAVDAARWPDRFRRVDLNQALPPGFAALEVRCYDFADALRPDLDRKVVEVRATTVTGRPAMQSVAFRAAAGPVASLRFVQAVRLDRPFRWRTVEVALDGRVVTSPWIDRDDWVPIVDATTPPEARPAPPPKEVP